MIKPSVALVLFLTCLTNAHGWGRDGHRWVGELAEAQLSSAARAEVTRLLAGESEPTLAGVSTWADGIRDQPDWKWTAPMHYVKFDDASCQHRAQRNCRDDLCVIGAIERYSRVLADRSRPDAERLEALKFVVHFIGDVHQPLHAGYRDDRGGNRFQVNIDGDGSNLHSVWDARVLDPGAIKSRHTPALLSSQSTRSADVGTAEQWASESCRLTDTQGFYPSRPGRLPEGYLDRFHSLASDRIAQAARRLAETLNQVMTTLPAAE